MDELNQWANGAVDWMRNSWNGFLDFFNSGVDKTPTREIIKAQNAIQAEQDHLFDLQTQSAQNAWDATSKAEELQHRLNQDSIDHAYDLYEKQRSSAYQVAVADMRKAGLNPILALGSPAPSSMPGYTSGSASARSAANISNENVSLVWNSLLKQLETSVQNANTAAEASRYNSDVNKYSADKQHQSAVTSTLGNVITALLPFVLSGGKYKGTGMGFMG